MWFSSLLPFFLLLSYSAYAEEMNVEGRLISGAQGIYSLELSNGAFKYIKSLPTFSIDGVNKIDEYRLLVSSFNLSPSKQRAKIAIYNLQSNELKYVLDGSRAIYIAKYKKIIFYGWKGLSITDVDGDFESIEVIDSAASAMPVVLVSSSEFLYERMQDGKYGIWKYNFESKSAKELLGLKDCSLSHAVWRSATNELLCSQRLENGRYTGKYLSTNLTGEKRQYISFGKGKFWPVIYIDSLDVIVLQERSASLFKGEFHPVHIYSFIDGSKTKIAEDDMLSQSIVYIRD
jgi:hypothetical protein